MAALGKPHRIFDKLNQRQLRAEVDFVTTGGKRKFVAGAKLRNHFANPDIHNLEIPFQM